MLRSIARTRTEARTEARARARTDQSPIRVLTRRRIYTQVVWSVKGPFGVP